MLSLDVTHIYILIHAHAHIRTKGKQSLKMLLLPLGVCVGWVIYKREYVRGVYKREYVWGYIRGSMCGRYKRERECVCGIVCQLTKAGLMMSWSSS